MHQELVDIRSQLAAALARVDKLLSGAAPEGNINALRYRLSPGGPLSPYGVAELHRRFAEGEGDSVIARSISSSA